MGKLDRTVGAMDGLGDRTPVPVRTPEMQVKKLSAKQPALPKASQSKRDLALLSRTRGTNDMRGPQEEGTYVPAERLGSTNRRPRKGK